MAISENIAQTEHGGFSRSVCIAARTAGNDRSLLQPSDNLSILILGECAERLGGQIAL